MVTAIAAATMGTTMAAMATKTMVATAMVGGIDDRGRKGGGNGGGHNGNRNSNRNGAGGSDKNNTNANKGASTTATRTTHPESALQQKTALLPRPSPSLHHCP